MNRYLLAACRAMIGRRLAGTMFAVICLTLAVAGAAQAHLAPSAAFLQALYADFQDTGSTGLALVDRIGAHGARVTIALSDLQPGRAYRLVISRARCFEPDSKSARIARVHLGAADPNGAIFETRGLGTAGAVWRGAWSLRLMEEEGIYYYCAAPHLLDWASTAHSDGAFARFPTDGGLAVTVPIVNDAPSVTIALNGLAGITRYRFVHSPLTCRQYNEGDPDQPIVVGTFRSDPFGFAFKARTETVNNNESITAGSNRVETVAGHALWGCANLHPYTLFLPPG